MLNVQRNASGSFGSYAFCAQSGFCCMRAGDESVAEVVATHYERTAASSKLRCTERYARSLKAKPCASARKHTGSRETGIQSPPCTCSFLKLCLLARERLALISLFNHSAHYHMQMEENLLTAGYYLHRAVLACASGTRPVAFPLTCWPVIELNDHFILLKNQSANGHRCTREDYAPMQP